MRKYRLLSHFGVRGHSAAEGNASAPGSIQRRIGLKKENINRGASAAHQQEAYEHSPFIKTIGSGHGNNVSSIVWIGNVESRRLDSRQASSHAESDVMI